MTGDGIWMIVMLCLLHLLFWFVTTRFALLVTPRIGAMLPRELVPLIKTSPVAIAEGVANVGYSFILCYSA